MKTRFILIAGIVASLAACQTLPVGTQNVPDKAAIVGEAAFQGFDKLFNAAIDSGQLTGQNLVRANAIYVKAHNALLALETGTGTVDTVLSTIALANGIVPVATTGGK